MNAQSEQIKGHAKSVAGIVTGDDELKAKGDTETKTAETVGRIDAAKDKAGDALDAAKDKAGDALDAAKDKAGDVFDAAKDKAGDAFDAAKDKLDDVADAAKKSVHRE